MLRDTQKIDLKNIFKKFEQIKIAYLFGSYAENKENKYSDIDIGLLLSDDFKDITKFKLDILGNLTAKQFDNIDVIILNNSSLLMQFEAVKHNNIIYKQDCFDSCEFFSIIVRKFFDFRRLLEVQRSYLKKRILDG